LSKAVRTCVAPVPKAFPGLAPDLPKPENANIAMHLEEGPMQAVTIKLSSQGQLVIPEAIREQLHWDQEMDLTLVPVGDGVLLQRPPEPGKRNLADLRGMLHYEGPPIPLDTLCKPVELTDEESEAYRR
jgi:bifunctional DNA-binding transcriptional regulator/antitoxin component of YhaV-PrlF toxin-antitoxin module